MPLAWKFPDAGMRRHQTPASNQLLPPPIQDVEELGKNDMEQISIDLGLSKRVYKEDEFYNPAPMFTIAAKKQTIHKILNNINENVLEKYYSSTFFILLWKAGNT